jgi:hypothetical protein
MCDPPALVQRLRCCGPFVAANEYSPPPAWTAVASPGTCEPRLFSLPAPGRGRSVCLAGRRAARSGVLGLCGENRGESVQPRETHRPGQPALHSSPPAEGCSPMPYSDSIRPTMRCRRGRCQERPWAQPVQADGRPWEGGGEGARGLEAGTGRDAWVWAPITQAQIGQLHPSILPPAAPGRAPRMMRCWPLRPSASPPSCQRRQAAGRHRRQAEAGSEDGGPEDGRWAAAVGGRRINTIQALRASQLTPRSWFGCVVHSSADPPSAANLRRMQLGQGVRGSPPGGRGGGGEARGGRITRASALR